MTGFLIWSGATLWALVGGVVTLALFVVVADAVKALRFIVRLWRAVEPEDRTWKFARGLVGYWMRLSVGAAYRPDHLEVSATGERVYWPARSRT